MSGQIEIKLVVNEVDHPCLYATLVAQANPRRRAALLRRLADDGCRPGGSRMVAATPDLSATLATARSHETTSGKAIQSIRRSTQPASRSAMATPRPIPANEPTAPAIAFVPVTDAAPLSPAADNVMLDAEAADQIFAAWG